jgi:soluble lytic murein transglycosylase-like protein
MKFAGVVLLSFLFVCATAADAQSVGPEESTQAGVDGQSLVPKVNTASICLMIENAAATSGLPFEFFMRIIWQESRMKPDAVGPTTRGGWQAQGIAQFMPLTAAERLLSDPFDPGEALPKSAAFLRELRDQFGNLGLAAAAYNAGPQRVRDWLAHRRRQLPSETQSYVRIVTGRAIEEWIRPGLSELPIGVPAESPCRDSAQRAAVPKPATTTVGKTTAPAWGIQLIGDRSEVKALAAYHALQTRYADILGPYQPIVARTTGGVGTAIVWNRVRVLADNRAAAELLCSRLRAAGESCLVQRN